MSRRRTASAVSVPLLSCLLAGSAWATPGSPATARAEPQAPVAPRQLTAIGDTVFFTATDDAHGRELWRTDGTAAGTRIVKEVRPGTRSAFPNDFHWAPIEPVRSTLFFVAADGKHGRELWRTDGTAAGTRMVRDLTRSGSSELSHLTAVGGKLYFLRTVGERVRLWRTDGTRAGTFPLDSDGSLPQEPADLYGWHGSLFFSAEGRGVGRELWRSNNKGTRVRLLKNIRRDYGGHVLPSRPRSFAGGDTLLYFVANDGEYRFDNTGVWRTDGTGEGTRYVKNVDPARDLWDDPPEPSRLTTVGDTLFFIDQDCTHGWEPWVSDGTTEGTVIIDLQPGEGECGLGSDPGGFEPFQGRVYLSARVDGSDGLWALGGTPLQPSLVAHFPSCDEWWLCGMGPIAVGDRLFVVEQTESRLDLWAGDGTSEGTVEIASVTGRAAEFTVAGDLLVFLDDPEGNLWVSDGTPEGTHAVFAP